MCLCINRKKCVNLNIALLQKHRIISYEVLNAGQLKNIRQLNKTLLREDYTVYRQLPGGQQTSYDVHAGVYKTRPNSVRTNSKWKTCKNPAYIDNIISMLAI